MNQKDLRIEKLHRKGLSLSQIARKLGYGGSALDKGIARVREGLNRLGITEKV